MSIDRAPSPQDQVKVSVLGAGFLGKEHIRIYSELAAAKLVQFIGIYDLAAQSAHKLASKYRVRAFDSLSEAAHASDALSIVTPTTTHHDIAKQLLRLGKHVLVEKPMTNDADQATESVQLAKQ